MISIATLTLCCVCSFVAGVAATFGLALMVSGRQVRR